MDLGGVDQLECTDMREPIPHPGEVGIGRY
jgi:hypothetical protein